MMQELFTVGENGMVELNKPWIQLVPEFRALTARDKGGSGDGSGRYKKKATREFTFIFHMLDYKSPLENNPLERENLARQFATLDEEDVKKLRADEEFMAAYERYEKFIETQSTKLSSLRSLKIAKARMDHHIETVDFSAETNSGALKYDMNKIQASMLNMPKLDAAIHDMEVAVRHELGDTADMRGGAQKGLQEDPDDDD